MNCRQFEDKILDLVRDGACGDQTRNQALEHAESCSHCSALLANQRALSAAIKLTAADDIQVPEHIEAALISAFRRRHEGTVRKERPLSTIRILPARYLGIAAALLVAFLGITVFRMLRAPQSDKAMVSRPASQQPLQKPSQPAARDATTSLAPDHGSAELASEVKPATKAAAPRQPAAKAAPETIEIATDFFALTSGAELNSMESGQLVRVQLPRNAMASFGLPINQERLDKPVTAQVLIGQDGVARAIRFLSEQNASFIQAGMRSKH